MGFINANKAYGAIKGIAGSAMGKINTTTDALANKAILGVSNSKYLNKKLGEEPVLNATINTLKHERAIGRGLAAGGLAGTAGIGALGYSAYNHFTD